VEQTEAEVIQNSTGEMQKDDNTTHYRDRGLLALSSIAVFAYPARHATLNAKTVAVQKPAENDDSDDTLRFFFTKSKLITVGEIVSIGPSEIACGESDSMVVRGFDVKITEVLRGDRPAKEPLSVEIVRFHDEWSSEVKKGDKVVLFLRPMRDNRRPNEPPSPWISADKWFGMRPYSASLVNRLRMAAKQKENGAEAKQAARLK
jgi:hypothetical protein